MSIAKGSLRGVCLAATCVVASWGAEAAADEPPPPTAEPPSPPAAEPEPEPAPAPEPWDVEPPPPPSPPPPTVDIPPPVIVVPPPRKRDYRLGLFESLGKNMLDSVSGLNLLLYGAAIGSTAALSASGADDEIQRWFWRDNAIVGDTVTSVAFISGWLTPLVIPGAVALTGVAVNDSEAASAGVAALQAVGINALVTQLTKIITARPLPYHDGVPGDDAGSVSIKRTGDGRKWGDYGKWIVVGGGVAWPSGHTSSHMALASALVAFYRKEKWLPFVAYPLVATMGLSMIEGDHHWFSDVVAGALVGHAIGWTVGSNMRKRYDAANGKPTDAASPFQIHPVVSQGRWMLVLSL